MLHKKLAKLRLDKDLSPGELAGLLETSKDTILLWEDKDSGQTPGIYDIIKLASIYEISTDELLGVEPMKMTQPAKLVNQVSYGKTEPEIETIDIMKIESFPASRVIEQQKIDTFINLLETIPINITLDTGSNNLRIEIPELKGFPISRIVDEWSELSPMVKMDALITTINSLGHATEAVLCKGIYPRSTTDMKNFVDGVILNHTDAQGPQMIILQIDLGVDELILGTEVDEVAKEYVGKYLDPNNPGAGNFPNLYPYILGDHGGNGL